MEMDNIFLPNAAPLADVAHSGNDITPPMPLKTPKQMYYPSMLLSEVVPLEAELLIVSV